MSMTRLLSLAAFAAAVAAVWWLAGVLGEAQDSGHGGRETRPGFYLGDFTLRQFNEHGALKYRATGKTMTEYPADDPADDIVEIEQFEMSQYPRVGAPLQLSARRARLSDDNNTMRLTGAVHVRRDKTAANAALDIKTEALSVDNRAGYMETDQPITIKTEYHVVTGVGLQAWPDEEKYHLARPRGRHEP